MPEKNCEEILMRLMAVFDGEETDFTPEQINRHLSGCADCRGEVERMQNAFALLKQQERREESIDLWSEIEPRISPKAKRNWQPLWFLAVSLVIYKLLEILPARDFGLAFKIVPFVIVLFVFVFLKENPFKINTELVLEKYYE